MIFADIVAALSKETGLKIETEGDACAIQAEATDGTSVTVLLYGLDRHMLLTCNEKAIPGDAIPGVANAAPVRITKFTRKNASESWKFISQRYYLPEPPSGNTQDSKKRNGVASVCVASEGRIFVLERECDKTDGLRFRMRIFEVVYPIEDGSNPYDLMPVLEKRLVYDEDTGTSMYEGMALLAG